MDIAAIYDKDLRLSCFLADICPSNLYPLWFWKTETPPTSLNLPLKAKNFQK